MLQTIDKKPNSSCLSVTNNCKKVTGHCSLVTEKRPHYRRTQEVYAVLNTAPSDATYDRLIEYVREKTGKGCSRKLISKWKKAVGSNRLFVTSKLNKNSQDKSDDNNTNVLPLVDSSEQNSLDSSFTEPISEINQVESQASATIELQESQANQSIICDEDKPDINHQTLLPVEEETTDILPTGSNPTKESTNQELLKRSPTNKADNNNANNDSLLTNDNDLTPTRDNDKTGHCSLVTGNCKSWSFFTVIAIVCGIVGASWFFSKDNSKPVIAQTTTIQNTELNSQNVPLDGQTTPIQNPKSKIQNGNVQNRKSKIQNGIPRTFKISLTVTSPQDLKVKPGDEIALGQVLSDRTTERQRLLAQKKQLEISLKKLDLPIPEITQPKPIPALSKLPSVSYQQEEANIALKQQELVERERAIANQKVKIKELESLLNIEPISNTQIPIQNELSPNQEQINNQPTNFDQQNLSSNANSVLNPKIIPSETELSKTQSVDTSNKTQFDRQSLITKDQQLPIENNSIQNRDVQNKEQTDSKKLLLDIQQPSVNSNSIQNPKSKIQNLVAVIEHEQSILSKLKADREQAKLQLDIAKSKLIEAKEQRAYIEYQRYVEENKRAIALQQQQIELERQRSIRAGQIQEREYSKTQIEIKIQEIDNAITQLSTVKAPYAGKLKKVKWTGQDNHNLTVQLTLVVDNPSEKPRINNP